MFRYVDDLYDDSALMETNEFRLALERTLEPYPEARRAVVQALEPYCPAPEAPTQPAPQVPNP